MRFARLLIAITLFACDGGGGADAGSDAGNQLACGRGLPLPELRWSHASVGVVPGASREVFVELATECLRDVSVELVQSESGIVDVPEQIPIALGTSRATFDVRGVRAGIVTLTASITHAASGDTVNADLEVVVMEDALPACDGEALADLAPGQNLEVFNGSLAGASIAIPAGAAREDEYHVDPFEAAIGCAPEEIVPEGYRALGPAVRFGPAHLRLRRELPLAIPISLALLPSGAHRGHVEVAYRGPNDGEGRIVGIASPRFLGSAGAGTLRFEVPRLGAYQAVARTDAPTRRTRTFTFRGLLGFSMGGAGTGRIGMGNPDLFDFIAPLGGPNDWPYLLEYIRNYHIGGFCTELDRAADPEGCAMGSSLARVPPLSHLHEHAQHFEHWWDYDDFQGQGGSFNRSDYISIFRDLGAMFGNPNFDASTDPNAPNVVPPGVPDSVRAMPDEERCRPENQVVIPPFDGAGDPLSGSEGRGFFDDEYNPDGTYPVITFCDGAETDDTGRWNPEGSQSHPIEVVVAVDIDRDGIRDPGEPLIRNGREPFDDFGLDGIANEDEEGFDPIVNPDPAGDDFDFQYNPSGTENNWERDALDGDLCAASERGVAEAFLDAGIDGVIGTRQLSPTGELPGGGFDVGEGDLCFTRSAGADRMVRTSPRYVAENLDERLLQNLDVLIDGGIRDLFNWAVMGNITMAGWASRGFPVRYYNDHSSLHLDDRVVGAFDHSLVPWEEVGRFAMVRYGHPDTSEAIVRAGDGGHVGTIQQLTDRLRGGLAMMSARWPDGDRARVTDDRICTVNDDSCEYVNSFVFDFTATTGRVGPVTVILPPGYFHEENAELTYPVVYFLHGYGMSPEDLVALGLLMWADMNSPRVGTERRMQKLILVFPDGRCRNGECQKGTFYTDAPPSTPNGARMETFLLDLMSYIDTNYRTRDSEEFEVLE